MEHETQCVSDHRLNEAREHINAELKKYHVAVDNRIKAIRESLNISSEFLVLDSETDKQIMKSLRKNLIRPTENLTRLLYRYATEYGLSIFNDIDKLTKDSSELQAIIENVIELVNSKGVPLEPSDISKASLFSCIQNEFFMRKYQEIKITGQELGSFIKQDEQIFRHYLAKALVFSDGENYEQNLKVLVHFIQTTKMRWLQMEDLPSPIQLLLYSSLPGSCKSTMVRGWGKFTGKYFTETTYTQLVGRFNTAVGATHLAVGIIEATEGLSTNSRVNTDNLNNLIDGREIAVERKGMDIIMLPSTAAVMAALNELPKHYRNRRNGIFRFIEQTWDTKELEKIEGLPKPEEWESIWKFLFLYCPKQVGEWDFRSAIANQTLRENDLEEKYTSMFRNVRPYIRNGQRESIAGWRRILKQPGEHIDDRELDFWIKSSKKFLRAPERQRYPYQDWIITPEFYAQIIQGGPHADGQEIDTVALSLQGLNSPYQQLRENIAKIPPLVITEVVATDGDSNDHVA